MKIGYSVVQTIRRLERVAFLFQIQILLLRNNLFLQFLNLRLDTCGCIDTIQVTNLIFRRMKQWKLIKLQNQLSQFQKVATCFRTVHASGQQKQVVIRSFFERRIFRCENTKAARKGRLLFQSLYQPTNSELSPSEQSIGLKLGSNTNNIS